MNDKNYLKLEQHRRELIDEIVKKIEEEELTFRELWNNDLARPQNPISGAKYNGANRLILGFEALKKGYKDPRWITFIQAKKKGYNLKKFSKSASCEKWVYSKEVKEKNEETGEIEKKIIKIKPVPNRFSVFNAELFENIPEYVPERKASQDKLKIINNLIKSSECEVRIVAQDRAFYMPTEDIIALPLIEHFNDDDSAIGVLLHEMAHSTGHSSRLNRENNFSKESYAREELVAEISSIFLEQDLGLELSNEKLNNNSAYLKSWLKVFKEDPHELFRATVEAEKSSNRILERYNEQLEQEKKLIKETIKEYQEKYPGENIIYAEKYENGNLKMILKGLEPVGDENIELYREYLQFYTNKNLEERGEFLNSLPDDEVKEILKNDFNNIHFERNNILVKESYREDGSLEKEVKLSRFGLIKEKVYSFKNELIKERNYLKQDDLKRTNVKENDLEI